MLMFCMAQCDEIESDADNEVLEDIFAAKIRFGGREGYEISKRIHTIIANTASGADDKKEALENTWQETDFEKLI